MESQGLVYLEDADGVGVWVNPAQVVFVSGSAVEARVLCVGAKERRFPGLSCRAVAELLGLQPGFFTVTVLASDRDQMQVSAVEQCQTRADVRAVMQLAAGPRNEFFRGVPRYCPLPSSGLADWTAWVVNAPGCVIWRTPDQAGNERWLLVRESFEEVSQRLYGTRRLVARELARQPPATAT